MELGDLLVRWTIRLALILYAAGVVAIYAGPRRSWVYREGRLAWTFGCVFLWLHFAAAFHFVHHWSHTAAYEATARDTEALLGWPFGAGVYFNYLFALVWTLDAIRIWQGDAQSETARGTTRLAHVFLLFHAFLLFMVFNATVVFGKGAVRWIAAAFFAILAVTWLHARRRRRHPLEPRAQRPPQH